MFAAVGGSSRAKSMNVAVEVAETFLSGDPQRSFLIYEAYEAGM